MFEWFEACLGVVLGFSVGLNVDLVLNLTFGLILFIACLGYKFAGLKLLLRMLGIDLCGFGDSMCCLGLI